jgi:hypothetical protein
MAFDQSTITHVNPPVRQGAEWKISWVSTSAPGTWWQIYINRVLAWSGQTTRVTLPVAVNAHVDIGAVANGEEYTDLSGELPAAPAGRRAQLTWTGSDYQSGTLAGFYVYSGDSPGAAADTSKPVGDITAHPGNINVSGYGYGPYGQTPYGYGSGTYSWISEQLANGTWNFAIVPYDSAGNAGTSSPVSVTINAPPQEVPPFADGLRLHYTFSSSANTVTLTWNASPG